MLIEWGEHVSKRYVSKELSRSIHKKAEPVITWLKEAEEESSEEEEEDDDEVCVIVQRSFLCLSKK